MLSATRSPLVFAIYAPSWPLFFLSFVSELLMTLPQIQKNLPLQSQNPQIPHSQRHAYACDGFIIESA